MNIRQHAIPAAQLIELSPDLAGLTDIAEVVGVTRQNMRKLKLTHAETFPAPIHEGSAALGISRRFGVAPRSGRRR